MIEFSAEHDESTDNFVRLYANAIKDGKDAILVVDNNRVISDIYRNFDVERPYIITHLDFFNNYLSYTLHYVDVIYIHCSHIESIDLQIMMVLDQQGIDVNVNQPPSPIRWDKCAKNISDYFQNNYPEAMI